LPVPPVATVLTIEDDPDIRAGICTYLEDSGFRMLQAADGMAGLALFRAEQPDAVLCDLRMPGKDGLDVLAEIAGEAPETPVIIVSGMNLLDYAVQALKRGAWDYVTKPIQDMAVVETALDRVLERSRLMRENREYREQLELANQDLRDALGQLQADEEAGRRIQSQLLPEDDLHTHGFRFRRRLYPSMYLSGDFLDYFPIGEHHVGFYLADVSGHDAAAAFVTVMLKMLIGQYRANYTDGGDDTLLHPGRLLTVLNQFLFEQRLGKYLTMIYGIIDRRQDTLVCAQGGHYPPPVMRRDGVVAALAARSRPVGLFAGVEYAELSIDLPRHFTLVCASDGLMEMLPGDNLSEKRGNLESRLAGDGNGLEALLNGMDLEGEHQLPDDVTLLEITREPDHG
jgi:serine phosphatase RsbU (regulator of sigma subunit)